MSYANEHRNIGAKDIEGQIQSLKDGIDQVWIAIEKIQNGEAVLLHFRFECKLKDLPEKKTGEEIDKDLAKVTADLIQVQRESIRKGECIICYKKATKKIKLKTSFGIPSTWVTVCDEHIMDHHKMEEI